MAQVLWQGLWQELLGTDAFTGRLPCGGRESCAGWGQAPRGRLEDGSVWLYRAESGQLCRVSVEEEARMQSHADEEPVPEATQAIWTRTLWRAFFPECASRAA